MSKKSQLCMSNIENHWSSDHRPLIFQTKELKNAFQDVKEDCQRCIDVVRGRGLYCGNCMGPRGGWFLQFTNLIAGRFQVF